MTTDSIIPKVWSFSGTLISGIGGENEKMRPPSCTDFQPA